MKTFVYNGKHLMVDILTKGTYNLNDPSRISSCLESIVDSLDMTMILPPIIVKFPHSTSELKRTLKSLNKEGLSGCETAKEIKNSLKEREEDADLIRGKRKRRRCLWLFCFCYDSGVSHKHSHFPRV